MEAALSNLRPYGITRLLTIDTEFRLDEDYRIDGSLDTSFGSNGTGGFSIDFGSADTFSTFPTRNATVIQADGKIVTVGGAGFISGPNAGYNFALARLWP